MSCEQNSVDWPRAAILTIVFALVAGTCAGTHYQEHHFPIGRWLTDVASAGTLLGLSFGTGLAVESLAVAVGVMGLSAVAGLVLFIFCTQAMAPVVMGPDLPLTLACFALGRLFRDRTILRGQFRLQTLLVLPLLVATAAWLVWLRAVPAVVPVLVAAAAVAAISAGYRLVMETPTRLQRWRDAVLLTLGCLYLPFAWIVLIDYPWNDHHLTWLKIWPVLPGGMGAVWMPWLAGWRPSDGVGLAIAGGGTLVLIGVCSWLAQRGRWSTLAAALTALAIAGFTSFAAHAAFRW